MRSLRAIGVVLLVGALAAGLAVHESLLRIPARWLPPDLSRPPGALAHLQLNGLSTDGAACRAVLGRAHLKFTPLPDRDAGKGCGFTDVVRAEAGPIAFNSRVTATCSMTAALTWYQQRLDALARQDLGTSITRIDQLGTYACRNINSATSGRLSQHATANAIDIAAFHLADGRTVSVLKDYGKPTPEGDFLDDAHEAACGLFNIVLGPKYNRLHANHFHLDMGPFRFCR
ncbi:MAG TPA: extensin family protein [Dongiaceae bacterium]|nr:extensin family protein [Dongiaceae bacterium]